MNYSMYTLYVASRKTIERLEANKDKASEETLSLLADLKLSCSILDEKNSEYAGSYNMEQEMVKSFTLEQQDFICNQIELWCLLWKENMWVDNKLNEHWLERGKDDLKTMICGD